MGMCNEKLVGFLNNRWLVFVAAIWVQSCAGIGYLFGSISPVIKTNLSYSQRQIARLGVAKDLGDSVGTLAGTLLEILPFWATLLVGAISNFVGYGWIWLIVTGRAPVLPLWAMCVLVFVGTNGETYFNTVSLVSCVQNFPKSRGPVVGILKGFAGLSGAILTQIYAIMHSPDSADLIFMIAVGPALVAIGLMFFIKPVAGHRQVRQSDAMSFTTVYGVCLLLAAYLMGVMLVEDLVTLSSTVIAIFTAVMFVILLIPFLIPVASTLSSETTTYAEQEALLQPLHRQEPATSEADGNEVILSEVEDEKSEVEDSVPASERQKRIAQLQAKLLQAAAEGAVRVQRRKGPRRGEDFTLGQALIKADFWLIFLSHLLGSGTGLTVIDNLGQMSESLGYDNTHIFVSLISIWNFLGRVGGGYLSEIAVRDYAYPRPIAMAIAQLLMIFGHLFIGMGWPGAMYIGTLITGLGYGAHWAIVPATASELFGLKKFAALYNFITLSTPMGSLIFSGLITSSIYDKEAEKQALNHLSQLQSSNGPLKCVGTICFSLTCMIMAVFCAIAGILSLVLVHRTRGVYYNLYGKSRSSTLCVN
ncbi:protein NUCLEAR FUSION DEFECTIVE 4-like [Cucurbita moschata]|uniref:Protein NUCLEAR FUSION DEFECTIVE 4-like n=1 Tax=Cucurbita moschata TaxID=3662 RepID=A0A6J1FKN7_CUCMO|nr:protein NUCLEAR FUSION DEFECTIVE 4-like [Cucurbita moschata]